MALDEATRALIAQMAESGSKPIQERTPSESRAMTARMRVTAGPGPDMAEVREVRLEAADGGTFDVRVLVPHAGPRAIVVYFHGGGWVTGHIDDFDTLGRTLAARSESVVVLVNYRKAPENPYPAAVLDAWRAVNWTADEFEDLGLPLIVAGDSAGGNLATVTCVRARDENGPDIAMQILAYPVTDCDLDTESYLAEENQLVLTRTAMQWFWNHYARPEDRERPDISPLRTPDLSGLPPVVLMVAEHDVLRTEQDAYAKALEAAGVPVDRTVVSGQTHGFFSSINVLPGARIGMDLVVEKILELSRACTPNPSGKG